MFKGKGIELLKNLIFNSSNCDQNKNVNVAKKLQLSNKSCANTVFPVKLVELSFPTLVY